MKPRVVVLGWQANSCWWLAKYIAREREGRLDEDKERSLYV